MRDPGTAHRSRSRAAQACVVAWLLCALLVGGTAQALIRKVPNGGDVVLAEDEGLLAIGVDSPVPLDLLRIERNGWSLNAGNLRRVGVGRSMQLYVVPVGRYRWDRVRVDGQTYTLADDAEFHFDVRAGRINYPGDLIVRPQGWYRVAFQISNRGLLAMDWLDREHPALAAAVDFAYAGHYPDPFPAFYRDATRGQPAVVDRHLAPPPSGPLPLSIEELWRPSRILGLRLNAAGDLLAETVREGEQWAVDLIDLRAGTSRRLIDSPEEIAQIAWTSDRNLIVSVGETSLQQVFVVRIRDEPDGTRTYSRFDVRRRGRVIDVLPQADHVLFASLGRKGVMVHALDVGSQASIDAQRFRPGDALNGSIRNDTAWFVDGNGALRVAVVREKDEGFALYHGSGADFRQVLRLEDLHGFQPHGLSADGNIVYGITDEGREQTDLVALDLVAGRITATLFSRPGVDVIAPLFDAERRLIGASYFEAGQVVSDYFDAGNEQIDLRLREAFPDRTVWVLDRDQAHRNFILSVSGADQPSQLYHLDLRAKKAALLDESRPWLAGKVFAPTRVLRSTSGDGLQIESYLTLPRGNPGVKLPLVVFPHGGPIGIRDARLFDPEVQFLASLGYAVLQVNFRGSTGFGRAFRDAGERSYGSLIEDDIDAALKTAIEHYPIDGTRMCALGASYGGYSALVSAIRWPGRFRCAVSMSGISDRILFFTASDTGRSEEGRALLEKAIGDPATETESMLAYSPLYRFRELTLPVMLVHGTEDRRVDYEHTQRLVRMLSLAGRPPTLLTLEGEGHGVSDPEQRDKVWSGVAGFLRTHLAQPAGEPAATPADVPTTAAAPDNAHGTWVTTAARPTNPNVAPANAGAQ